MSAAAHGHRLRRDYFNRPTLLVARDLLGKFIVRDTGSTRIAAMINEVEAYKGPLDRAAHTHAGRRTRRVEPLYGDGGTVYAYLVYGLHWLLNFSTAGHGKPEGALVRGVVGIEAGKHKAVIGPGRVGQYLHIDAALSGDNVADSARIWVEDRGVQVRVKDIRRGPRVGIDYAGPYYAARPWRFWIDVAVGVAPHRK